MNEVFKRSEESAPKKERFGHPVGTVDEKSKPKKRKKDWKGRSG